MELIPFAKKLHFTANPWDPAARSAVEFCRQMGSSKLKKRNPAFDCAMAYHDLKQEPTMHAEFADGSVWKTSTQNLTAAQLRLAFYEKATVAEEKAELANIAVETEAVAPSTAAKGKSAAKNTGKK